jgi:FkbM family methyltransferase
MIKAAFVTPYLNWPWRRQLPTGSTSFGEVQFFADTDDADVVFVYDALPERRLVLTKPTLTVFIASEPPNVKRYNQRFLDQFDAVITADRETPHPHRIFTQAGLPWHVGTMSAKGELLASPMMFEELETYSPIKSKLVSVVSSDKTLTAEHRARLAFVAKLKEALGDEVDVFGRGIADFSDKRDVLDEYRYHIALENCAIEDYWTEKLADPFLTSTFPIYHGCPNAADYFPAEAFRSINIYEPENAVAIIKDVIHSNIAEQNSEHLNEARRRVMFEHNVFALLARTAQDLVVSRNLVDQKVTRAIFSEFDFLSLRTRFRVQLVRFVEPRPALRRMLRAIKYTPTYVKKRAAYYRKYLSDGFYRSHQRWITDNPSEELRFNYDLPLGANILDVGGYAGDFVAKFRSVCDADVTVFEPIPSFAETIRNRFAGDGKVRLYEAGLSDRDETVEFDLDADASGAFGASDGKKVEVSLLDAERALKERGVTEWHLAKLNIEGGEFALLDRLIDTNRIETIKHLQVQFHLHVPDARKKYKKLAKRLRRTHRLEWRYPFVWESWVRRKDLSN